MEVCDWCRKPPGRFSMRWAETTYVDISLGVTYVASAHLCNDCSRLLAKIISNAGPIRIRNLEAKLRAEADHDLRDCSISAGHERKLLQQGLSRALELLEGKP